MNLFKTKKQFKSIDLEPLISETPIGDLTFNAHFSGKSLLNFKPKSTNLIDDNGIVATWIFDECQIEFLTLNIIPHLPTGMQVSHCLSGIWRVKVLKNHPIFNFECTLNYMKPNFPDESDVFIESGEGLAAQTWETPVVRLTIGTEDEDYLQQRASDQNWLPYRFKDLINPNSIEYLKNGIKISLPEFRENEVVQIHFSIAWTFREIATWFAVDERVGDILKQASIE